MIDLDALLKRHPLPWTCDKFRVNYWRVHDGAGEVVAEFHRDDEAIARLLAAAPAMMRAIQSICPPGPTGIYATVPLTTALRESLP